MPTDRKEYNRRYYEKNREKAIADAKEYYEANREQVIANRKVYFAKNADVIREKGREYYRRRYRFRMLCSARQRARIYKLEIDIDMDDIVIPERCPLLGIPLYVAEGRKHCKYNSPSLDRIDPKKGYVKGNVWVISHKANTMKSNASIDEHILLVENWKDQHSKGYPKPIPSTEFLEKEA
jgi:hypothetical protein